MAKSKTKQKQSSGPVWSRRVAGRAGEANVAYCAGWDVRGRAAADWRLVPYDVWTNRAHCTMLARTGVIDPPRLDRILKALDALMKHYEQGGFELDPNLEDVHLNIESFVESQAGADASGVMHTARSRNDQVATTMRLWLRERTIEFARSVAELARALAKLARRETKTLMPGLTHHQPGAWTTLGHWAAAHAFAFSRDVRALIDLLGQMDVSPLGAAASFGSSWPIDRGYAASLLGFSAPQGNSLDAVTNRCEFEARVAGALAVWAQHAATLSQDLILFSSPPWSIFRLDDAFVTGSSIMPQKRNPDFAEVTKAKAALAGSAAATLLDLTRGDPSGYNREQQWSKYLVFDLFDELGAAPGIAVGALGSMQFDRKRMREVMAHDFLEGADVADYLAQTRGRPFRETYRWLGEAVRVSDESGVGLAEAVNAVLESESNVEPLSAEEREQLASPDFLVGRRSSEGGPSPDAVRAQTEALGAVLKEDVKRLRAIERAIDGAKRRLEKAQTRYRAT